jgi:hypothetical protein
MSLVRCHANIESAAAFSNKLRTLGIPTYIGIHRSNDTNRYGGGPKIYGVWVLLDSQLEDAKKLIKGNQHKVENPLTEEEMVGLENSMRANRKSEFLKVTSYIIVILLSIAFSIMYFISHAYKSLNSV